MCSWFTAWRDASRNDSLLHAIPQLSSSSLASSAADEFRRAGCLRLSEMLPSATVDELRTAYLDRYGDYLTGDKLQNALQVGNRRHMITVELEAPFLDHQLYANPLILPVLRQLLGDDLVLGSFASVTSLPGAKMQHLHRDTTTLFDANLDRTLPTYAITLFIPLREFNESNGTTRLLLGSHVKLQEEGEKCQPVEPVVPLGGALLLDYRLLHQGTANRSNEPRPMLYFVYHRSWFKDYLNYRKQPFLKLSAANRIKIPEEHRPMFRWTEHYDAGLF